MAISMERRSVFKMLAACGGAVLLAACGAGAPSATSVTSVPATATIEMAATTGAEATAVVTAEATDTAPTSEATATTAPAQPEATAAPQAAARINLNTATADEFMTIPNVGQRMVREFNEYRPYTTILQFRREIGKYVDEATVAEYEKYVYVPVSPNNADAATLQQLSGVDQAVAGQLIAARPYESRDAFLKKLGELVTPEQASAAAAYVEVE